MAEVAGDGESSLPQLLRPNTRLILRQSLDPFLSFASLTALLLSALLLFSFRFALYSAALRLVVLAEKFDPSLPDHSLTSPSPPPPPRPLSLFPSIEPDPFFSFSRKPSKVTKVPNPPSHPSPFFIATPPETKPPRQKASRQESKEIAYFLLILFLIMSAYGLIVSACLTAYSCALGVVFYSALSITYLKRHLVPLQLFLSGSKIGVYRLFIFMFLQWAMKYLFVNFLSLFFLFSIEDDVSLCKLMINSILIPFSPVSLVSPLGYSPSLSDFFLTWASIDALISIFFTMLPWIELMEIDDNRRDKAPFKEGLILLSLMPSQAIYIKWFEAVLSSSLIVKIAGKLYGGLIFSIIEVYFMVVWFHFYLYVRCKEAELAGKKVELKELEDSLDDLR